MNLRKVMAMMAAAVMVMGVAGCSSSSTTTTDTASDDSADKTVIGIVQMADNGAFTDMREGFIAEMNDFETFNKVYSEYFNGIVERINSTKDLQTFKEFYDFIFSVKL